MPPNDPLVLTVILNWCTAEMTLRAAAAALREMEGIEGEIIHFSIDLDGYPRFLASSSR